MLISNEVLAYILSLSKINRSEYRGIENLIVSALEEPISNESPLTALEIIPLLYELPVTVLLVIFFQELGVLERIQSVIEAAEDANLALLELAHDEGFVDSIELDLSDNELKSSLAAVLYVLNRNFRSLGLYGLHIHELLERGRDGDDKRLFDAVRIDRAIITGPSVSKRITLASITNDKKFLKALRNALKGVSGHKWKSYDSTRLIAKALTEGGRLGSMSIEELFKTFCTDLEIYPITGSDPARNLHRFIQRYRNDTAVNDKK